MSPAQHALLSGEWPELGKFWTLPNALSLIRLALGGPITYLILIDASVAWILGLCLLAMVTDWVDGRLARWSKSVSDWGKVLDPLCDKVAGTMVVLALVVRGSLPVWLIALLLVRDVLIVLGGIVVGRKTGIVLMSMWPGKIAVGVLALTVLAAILKADPGVMNFCIWATVVMMAYSFLLYVVRFVVTLRGPQQDAQGAGQDVSMPSVDEQARSLS